MSENSKAMGEFLENATSNQMIYRSLKLVLPSKNNHFGFWLSTLLAAPFAFIVGASENTVSLLADTSRVILTIQLASFSAVLVVFSIIFLFFDSNEIKLFAKLRGDEKDTLLGITTMAYQSTMFLFFVNIGVIGIAVLFSGVLSIDFRLTDNLSFDRALAILLLFIYYSFCFRVFYELKSVIYNTVQLFRIRILIRLSEHPKNEEYENEEYKDRHT